MEELFLEVYDSIREINFKIQEMEENDELMDCELGEGYCPYLELQGNDVFFKVNYLSFTIWRSDEDDRKEIVEETETNDPMYEPIINYLERKINSINKIIGKIKI